MKFLGLIIVILVVIKFCSADTNRSTIWVIADEQIYSTKKGYQECAQLGPAGSVTINLVKTAYYEITATDAQVYTPKSTTAIADSFALATLTLTFTYDSDNTKTFTLGAYDGETKNSITALTSVFGTADNNILTASGNTWLTIQSIGTFVDGTTTPVGLSVTADSAKIAWSAVLITDYKSNTTVTIIAWMDGADAGTDPTSDNQFNNLYSIFVRTPTDLLVNTGNTLVAGCTDRSRKKRSVLNKRAVTTCSIATSSEPSFANNADSICSNIATTNFGNILSAAATSMTTVRSVDNALFAAAGPKFTIAVNFGVLIAMSSAILSLLN